MNVNNITISGLGYSFSGGTLNVIGGIQTTVNTTIASALTLAAAETWLCSSPGQTLTVAGNVANNGNLLTLGGTGNVLLAGLVSGSGGLIKNGSNYGTLILGGSKTFTGNVTVDNGILEITNGMSAGTGPKTVTADLGTDGNCQLVLNGSGGNINLPANITFVTSNQSTNGTVFNDGGNNTIFGSFTLTSGGGATWFVSNSGQFTLTGNLMPNTTGRYLYLSGRPTVPSAAGSSTVRGQCPGFASHGARDVDADRIQHLWPRRHEDRGRHAGHPCRRRPGRRHGGGDVFADGYGSRQQATVTLNPSRGIVIQNGADGHARYPGGQDDRGRRDQRRGRSADRRRAAASWSSAAAIPIPAERLSRPARWS